MSDTRLTLKVEFHVKAAAVESLTSAARQVDIDNDVEPEDDYTLAQALTVILHNEPERLFSGGFLDGWAVVGSWDTLGEG